MFEHVIMIDVQATAELKDFVIVLLSSSIEKRLRCCC